MTNEQISQLLSQALESNQEGISEINAFINQNDIDLSLSYNSSINLMPDNDIHEENQFLTTSDYNAFAVPVKVGNEIHVFYMKATEHISGGSIARRVYNINDNTFSPEEIVFSPSGNDKHYIGLAAGHLGGKLFLFFCDYDKVSQVHTKMYVASTTTDLNTWGSLTDLPFALNEEFTRFNFYGKMVHSETDGKAFIHWFGHTLPLTESSIYILETNDYGDTWQNRLVHNGQAAIVADTYTESAICKIESTKYVLLARNEQGKRLGVSVSEDDCQTWTDIQETNLGSTQWQSNLDYDGDGDFDPTVTRTKMAALEFDGNNLVAFFHDRSDGFLKVSKTPLSQLELDWTNWNEPDVYLDNRPEPGAITSFREGLGYPNMVDTGKKRNGLPIYRMFWGLEGSLNRCDVITSESDFSNISLNNIRHPEGFQVSQDVDSNNLSWNPVANALEYEIYRSDNYDGEYTLISTVQETTFEDSLVRAYYYVVALGEFSNSHRSLIIQSEI